MISKTSAIPYRALCLVWGANAMDDEEMGTRLRAILKEIEDGTSVRTPEDMRDAMVS